MAKPTPTLAELHRHRTALQAIRDGLAVPTDAELGRVSAAAAAANRVLEASGGPFPGAVIAECVLILVLAECIREDLGAEDGSFDSDD